MAEPLIDLKALLVEREECNAGTVAKLREGLAQGGTQYKTLREVGETLQKKLESASGPAQKNLHLKLGIVRYFQGQTQQAIENLKHADGALANFYLGRLLAAQGQYDEALKAFERSEKSGYAANVVQLQKAAILRMKGELKEARQILAKQEEASKHTAEYHYQLACVAQAEGDKPRAVQHLEKAVEQDQMHTGALFQLGYINDLAGNDEEAIRHYESCLRHPPVHLGALNNLGVLYEDNDRYDKAVECFNRIIKANPADEQARERARLFLKDAQASQTMYYHPDEDQNSAAFRQVMEVPVTDFELSVRSRNCLKKMNIKTLGDLTRVTEQQLLASKNFGETSLEELREIMGAKGLRIGQSLEQGVVYEPRSPRHHHQAMTPEEQAVMNKPVMDLNLSVRARKCMNKLNISTVGELCSRTADELLEAKNFGMTSLNEVRDKLAAMGLKLRGD
jgi:DNA-directed RNA polymerase subunit alpha